MSVVKRKVVKSAIVVAPPKSVWDSIQQIRKVHDKSYVRWLPHINVIYPFAVDSEFATLKPIAIEALKNIQPFDITFNEFKYFEHGKKSATLWLHPTENQETSPLQEIENQLVSTFPSCRELISRENGFVPHLSVGQFKGKVEVERFQKTFQRDWKPIQFTVKCLYFISRTDSDPFEVRAIIPLGGLSIEDVASEFTENQITMTPKSLPKGYFKLFVGGLPSTISKEILQNIFEQECNVIKISVPVDHRTKNPKGFAFVEATGKMNEVIASLHGYSIAGKNISVRKAK